MAPPAQPQRGVYVYGVVESDLEVIPGRTGVAEAPVELIGHGPIAALVSEVELDRPLGSPDDLFAHKDLLDAAAADAPVLPFRFGAVVSSKEAVIDELVAPREEEFADALRELDGKAQYVVRARYVEDALLRDILANNRKASQLREKIGPQPDESTRNLQIQLGEIVGKAVEAKRDADTMAMVEALEAVTVAIAIREPTHELDAAHVAILERVKEHSNVEDRLTALAKDWAGQTTVRLLGPMAPYDFVVTTQ